MIAKNLRDHSYRAVDYISSVKRSITVKLSQLLKSSIGIVRALRRWNQSRLMFGISSSSVDLQKQETSKENEENTELRNYGSLETI